MEGRKILVVDDEQDCVSFVESILGSEGAEIISACDGEEGLKKVTDENPDLMILDVNMPKKDGMEVFNELRQNNNNIPIIMLTSVKEQVGYGFSKEEVEEFFSADLQSYVEKPIDPEKLVEVVKSHLP